MRTRCKVFMTGIYLRLSREDGDKSESDSIQGQRKLTHNYIDKSDDLVYVDEYVDDGFSGTNFNRPSFKRMIADIRSGRINCVIVKDLSRFGREYIGVGSYLEKMFVDYGVRFIAINDNVDSLDGEYDIIVPIKNLFNTQYAIDISKKVQSSFKVKQRSGEFVGAFASYGYRKSESDRHVLIIDEYAAAVVRRIFDMFISGMGKVTIAKRLNDDGILCPSAYKKASGLNYTNCNRLDTTTYWTYSSVCRVLENQMYIGNMVQGKTKRRMKGKARQLSENEWIIVKGTHEPIVSMDTWQKAQTLLARDTRTPNFEQNVSPFAGFIKCGDCGRAMCKKRYRNAMWYTCGSYTRYGTTACTTHYVSYSALEQVILEDLQKIISTIDNLAQMINEESQRESVQGYNDSERQSLKAEFEKVSSQKLALYTDYRDGLIDKKEYIVLKAQYEERERLAQQKLESFDETESSDEDSVYDIPWVKRLAEYRTIEAVDRELLADLIDTIYVYEDNRIRIVYNFDGEYSSLLESRVEKTA